jgi:serine/threonine protein kinase
MQGVLGLANNSKHSGVPEDPKSPTLGVLGFTPTLGQSRVATDQPMRHRIALGIARGISFLHTKCNPPIVHGDVKPNNVLLDADWEPHLSDFGLTALTRIAVDPTPSSSSVGSLGYVSPEANESGELIQEADVYSFGRVLLQLSTRWRPAVFNVLDEDIAKWGKRML